MASNTVGRVASNDMTVRVEMPPAFTRNVESFQVEEGTVVTFVCAAIGIQTVHNWVSTETVKLRSTYIFKRTFHYYV